MLNFSAHKFFQLTAAAALASVLTACGGGGGGASSSNAQAAAQPAAVQDAKLNAFSLADRASTRIELTQDSAGNEVLLLSGANQQTQELTIKSRDAEGNIKDIASAHFNAITSLLGNRVGFLFAPAADVVSDAVLQEMMQDMGEDKELGDFAKYVFFSDDLVEVIEPLEFLGKTYDMHLGVKNNALFKDFDGKEFTDIFQKSPQNIGDKGLNEFLQSFTAEGFREENNNSEFLVKSKAYKYAANGQTTYILSQVSTYKYDDGKLFSWPLIFISQ